jgi:hypothetical protein
MWAGAAPPAQGHPFVLLRTAPFRGLESLLNQDETADCGGVVTVVLIGQ